MNAQDLIHSIAGCAGCIGTGCHNHMGALAVTLTQARGVARRLFGKSATVVRLGSGHFQTWVCCIDGKTVATKYSGRDLVVCMIAMCRAHGVDRKTRATGEERNDG